MNLLVCISKTPETTAKIDFIEGNSQFNTEGVQYIMNPYDEWYALVRAIEMKEKHGGKVIAINVGPAANDIVIRKALAIGADEAIRVDADPTSSIFVGKQIAEYAKANAIDIIYCGKETIDYNGAEVGAIVAEYCELPFISFASKMDFDGTKAIIERDIEGGVEIIEVEKPFVLSASKGLAEQRIPNMKGIMMAKRKPLSIVEAVACESNSQIKNYTMPSGKTEVKMIDPENMDELVRLLHEEAKVI